MNSSTKDTDPIATGDSEQREETIHAPAGPPLAPPPYLREIHYQARDRAQAEEVKSVARALRLRQRLDELEAVEAMLLAEVTEAEKRLMSIPDKPDIQSLSRRRTAERRARRPRSLIRQRRQLDHQRRRDELARQVEDARRRYRKHCQEVARMRGTVAAEERVRNARVSRVHELAQRRMHAYWRHLLRHHPHGPRLAAELARLAVLSLPDWPFGADQTRAAAEPSGTAQKEEDL